MRSDGTKKSPVRMLVYLLLLAAVVALGYFTDIVDFTELKAVFSLKLTALLKLAVMVLLVLLVSNLVIFILHGIKPRTHRGGSVLSLLSSLVKYVAGIIIVCQSLSLLGVNVGTIIASVGVLALVVGFSAESLIADVVIGAFSCWRTSTTWATSWRSTVSGAWSPRSESAPPPSPTAAAM